MFYWKKKTVSLIYAPIRVVCVCVMLWAPEFRWIYGIVNAEVSFFVFETSHHQYFHLHNVGNDEYDKSIRSKG